MQLRVYKAKNPERFACLSILAEPGQGGVVVKPIILLQVAVCHRMQFRGTSINRWLSMLKHSGCSTQSFADSNGILNEIFI